MEIDDKVKVNKVAVSIDDFGGAKIVLYKTNTKLGEINNITIDVPDYEDSNIPNKNIYVQYCRDIVINLLNNDGIPGFYYEEKEVTESIKYGKSYFMITAKSMLDKLINDMGADSRHIQYNVMYHTSEETCVKIAEKYKDGNIKYGTANFDVEFSRNGKKINVIVQIHIKSGQLCKPKTMIINDIEERFNITTIASMLNNK